MRQRGCRQFETFLGARMRRGKCLGSYRRSVSPHSVPLVSVWCACRPLGFFYAKHPGTPRGNGKTELGKCRECVFGRSECFVAVFRVRVVGSSSEGEEYATCGFRLVIAFNRVRSVWSSVRWWFFRETAARGPRAASGLPRPPPFCQKGNTCGPCGLFRAVRSGRESWEIVSYGNWIWRSFRLCDCFYRFSRSGVMFARFETLHNSERPYME